MKTIAASTLGENPDDSENVRKIKTLYQAIRSKDQRSLHEILADDPVWDVAPGFPDAASILA